MRSDISALLQQISGKGAEDDADQRGLVIHGNVQTIVLARTISVDTLHLAAHGDENAAEKPPPVT